MPTNLTGSQINNTYNQLLHVEDGPTATEKTVYGGAGVATALKVGTTSVSIDNVRFSASGITPITGTFNMSDVVITSGQVTGITTFSTTNATITGGVISGITDLAVADGGTGASSLTGYVKGNGAAAFTASATIPFADLGGRAYASFYDADTADQTGSTTAATAVQWATAAVAGDGITVTSNSRITLAAAGTYRFNINLQFNNTEASDKNVDIWFSKNGTNIASSNSRITVPKTSDGGTTVFAIELFETVTAGQYVEVYWYPQHANVTLHYRASVAANPGVTPAIPVTPPAIVVVERIA
jgi:hypothetical protein